MNKLKYLLLIGLLSAAAFSCKVEEDYIWDDEYPTDRVDAELARYKEILTSAPNGWIVNYYTGYTSEKNGYTLLMKFDDEYNVTVATDYDIKESVDPPGGQGAEWPAYPAGSTYTSVYDLGGDMGPSLNFVTYNDIFHYFSTPESAGTGEGDRGFIFMSGDNDRIELKGKKSRRSMSMEPMPEDITWDQFIQQLKTTRRSLGAYYNVNVDGVKVAEASIVSRSIVFYLQETEGKQFSKRYGFNLNLDNAMYLSKSVELDSYEINGFTIESDGRTLTSIEGDGAVTMEIVDMPMNELFKRNTELFSMDSTAWSSHFERSVRQMQEWGKEGIGDGTYTIFTTMYLGYSPWPDDVYDGNMFVYGWYDDKEHKGFNSAFPVGFNCDETEEDVISFEYLQDRSGLNDGGWPGQFAYEDPQNLGSFKGPLRLFEFYSPWRMENLSDDANPTRIKFVSINTSSAYFEVYLPQ